MYSSVLWLLFGCCFWCSVAKSCSTLWTPWTVAQQSACPPPFIRVCSISFSLSWWCYLTISSSAALLLLHSIFPSISLCQWVGLHIRWPKYWSFSNSSSNEYSGLISFRIDWFALFAVQGTLKSLLQHHNLKASILQCSAFFFMIQLPRQCMTIGKNIALTILTILYTLSAKWCLCFLICCLGWS